jgi:hypothetical protein
MKLAIVLAAAALFAVNATPLQLVSVKGICKSESQVSSYLNTCGADELSLVGIVDCMGGSDVSLVNALFNTAFEPGTGKCNLTTGSSLAH